MIRKLKDRELKNKDIRGSYIKFINLFCLSKAIDFSKLYKVYKSFLNLVFINLFLNLQLPFLTLNFNKKEKPKYFKNNKLRNKKEKRLLFSCPLETVDTVSFSFFKKIIMRGRLGGLLSFRDCYSYVSSHKINYRSMIEWKKR